MFRSSSILGSATPVTVSKTTALFHLHNRLGGRMVNYAGYMLPLYYTKNNVAVASDVEEEVNGLDDNKTKGDKKVFGISSAAGAIAEHLHTRSAATLFDVSHMGQLSVISTPVFNDSDSNNKADEYYKITLEAMAENRYDREFELELQQKYPSLYSICNDDNNKRAIKFGAAEQFIKWLTPVDFGSKSAVNGPKVNDSRPTSCVDVVESESKASSGYPAKLTLLTNPTGGVIDDCIVTRHTGDNLGIVVNAACKDKDLIHLRQRAAEFDEDNEIIYRFFNGLDNSGICDGFDQYLRDGIEETERQQALNRLLDANRRIMDKVKRVQKPGKVEEIVKFKIHVNLFENNSLLALQGPLSASILSLFIDGAKGNGLEGSLLSSIHTLPFMHCRFAKFNLKNALKNLHPSASVNEVNGINSNGIPGAVNNGSCGGKGKENDYVSVKITRCGYTGEDGFEIAVVNRDGKNNRDAANEVANALLEVTYNNLVRSLKSQYEGIMNETLLMGMSGGVIAQNTGINACEKNKLLSIASSASENAIGRINTIFRDDRNFEIAEMGSKSRTVKMAGLSARDTLRMESGMCLYGHEINADGKIYNPVAARLMWLIPKNRLISVENVLFNPTNKADAAGKKTEGKDDNKEEEKEEEVKFIGCNTINYIKENSKTLVKRFRCGVLCGSIEDGKQGSKSGNVPKVTPIPREGTEILPPLNDSGSKPDDNKSMDNTNNVIGIVTSGCPAPSLNNRGIAQAYIDREYAILKDNKPNDVVLNVRGKVRVEAAVVPIPFLKTSYYHLK